MNEKDVAVDEKIISILRHYALVSYEHFWSGRETELDLFLRQIFIEAKEIEAAAAITCLPLNQRDARRVKAVWVLSGVGTYLVPVTDEPGDKLNLDKIWIYGSDKKRIDYALDLIKKISLLASGEYKFDQFDDPGLSRTEMMDLIENFGPTLVYNGIESQNNCLASLAHSGKILLPEKNLCILENEIKNSLDQTKTVKFPGIKLEAGDVIGIVSHAPHLARVVKMLNKYRPLPSQVDVKLFPLVFENLENESKFLESELKGIIGYISQGLATPESYPYSFFGDASKPAEADKVVISPITEADVKSVFNLSNQPSVRKNSFNEEVIDFNNHKKWFSNKLEDKNVIMLKAEYQQKFAGQARLEIDQESALVGVSVDQEFRGKGIGLDLLRAIITAAKKRDIKKIDAFIKPENVASCKLFEKAGFVYNQETKFSGKRALKYINNVDWS